VAAGDAATLLRVRPRSGHLSVSLTIVAGRAQLIILFLLLVLVIQKTEEEEETEEEDDFWSRLAALHQCRVPVAILHCRIPFCFRLRLGTERLQCGACPGKC
jgi:hypothetical protein